MSGISVVIRTFNSSATLPAVLARLPLGPEDELVVVDSGSTDTTDELVRAAGARLVTLKQEEFTYGRSLNRGFAAAKNPWVLALSSHCVPVPDDLLGLYRSAVARSSPRLAAAVGPLLLSRSDWGLRQGITYYVQGDFDGGFGLGAGNPNSLYRRALWEQRPFDEALVGSEDLDWYLWAVRQGHELAVVHAAAVDYRSRGGARHHFHKGRIDYRASSRFIQVPRPSLPVVITHSLKILLYLLLGRIPPAAASASFWHYLGSYWEARHPQALLQVSPR